MDTKAYKAPTPGYLKKTYKLSSKNDHSIAKFRREIAQISYEDPRLLCIVGPCSIHHGPAFYEYAQKLSALQKKVEPCIRLVCRAYIEKPRTGFSWKGYLHQPNPQAPPCYLKGLHACRSLMIDSSNLNIPLAMEFVDPLFYYYFDDLISWGCIGARTSSSQPHRQLAALSSFACGFKNSIEGNIESAINGMIASSQKQMLAGISDKGHFCFYQGAGNPSPHLVLRGSLTSTNYDTYSVLKSYDLLKKNHLEPKIIIDCSHDNSKKNLEKQKEIFYELVEKKTEENLPIIGLMLESFLQRGSQQLSPAIDPYISLTDPCLGWEETQSMILWAYSRLKARSEFFKNSSAQTKEDVDTEQSAYR